MSSDRRVNDLQKFRAQSARRLWPEAKFAMTASALVLAVWFYARTHGRASGFPWPLVLLIASFWVMLIGDWLNVRFIVRRLSEAAGSEQPAVANPPQPDRQR